MSKLNTSQMLQTAKASLTNAPSGILQRKCASCSNHTIAGGKCEECKNKKGVLQRKSSVSSEHSKVPPIVHEVLNSSGQPLDESTRAFFEPRFAHNFSRVPVSSTSQKMSQSSLTVGEPTDVYEQEADRIADSVMLKEKHENKILSTNEQQDENFDLSQVRIHTDARAAESARAVNARAYTVGDNIVFGAGQFAPATHWGRRLLAHELTHVIQSASHQKAGVLQMSDPSDTYEREAATIAEHVTTLEKHNDGNHSQQLSTNMLLTPILLRDPKPDFVPDKQDKQEQEKREQDKNKPLIPIPIFDQVDPTVIMPDIPGLPGLIKGQPIRLSTLQKALDILRGKKPDSGQNEGDCARFGMEKPQLGPFKGQCCKKYKRDANNCCLFNDISFRSGRCCTKEEVMLPNGECYKPKLAPITVPKPPPVETPQLQDAPQRILPEGTEYA